MKNTKEETYYEQLHNIHPYPAKFPYFVAEKYIDRKFSNILDPYCGSGTTILEATKKNIKAFGFDCNPIATLVSKSKLLQLSQKSIELELLDIEKYFKNFEKLPRLQLSEFNGKEHWFKKEIQIEIEIIKHYISNIDDKKFQIFYRSILSSLVNKYSNQDSETRYVSIEKSFDKWKMLEEFKTKSKKFLKLYLNIKIKNNNFENIYTLDLVKDELPIKDSSIDLVITSPPYANTMDYYLYHKQRMNILDFDFKKVQQNEIGSRHEYSSKKEGKEKWFDDFQVTLSNISQKVKNKGEMIFVMGDSQIAGELIDASKMVRESAKNLSLKFEILESYPMAGKSRYFNRAFQAKNKHEHILKLIK